MHLEMDGAGIAHLKSRSQKARLVTENWASANVTCPICESGLAKYTNNAPVADFFCSGCAEDFELKSTSGKLGMSIPDGAYTTMMQRLSSHSNPNLLLLEYDAESWSVRNLAAIPKYYFTPNLIQMRPPLSPTARRAGWVGCNILIGNIPSAGKIRIVSNGVVERSEQILIDWRKTGFLAESKSDAAKGWLLQTMQCIDRIGRSRFALQDVYEFENSLRSVYPKNDHIREKLRQQLQILRNQGYLRFVARGVYELA